MMKSELGQGASQLSDMSVAVVVGQLINALTVFASYYVFTVLCLQHQPITARPAFSAREFFHWLGRIALKFLIIFAAFIPCIVIGIVLQMKVLVVITAVLGMGVMWFLMIKYLFVGPLAVSRVSPVLKTSWHLTDNNWWRLFWNYLAFGCILGLVFLVLFVALGFMSYVVGIGGLESPIYIGGVSLIAGVATIAMIGTSISFICTANYVLYQEQQSAL
ncbi:MAG: hypothetical protein SFW62_04525 [Alphaproteobacteria bacterium]|nr:hypothetical protein [Alphaproteobacteria bacterium]